MNNERVSNQVKFATMLKDIEFIRAAISSIQFSVVDLNKKMDEHYVSKIEFEPIKRIVYGLVGLTLVLVFSAILAIVIIQ